MKAKIIIAGLMVAAVTAPAFSSAQTVEVQAQSLIAQIQALQLQLKALIASSTQGLSGSVKPMMNNDGMMAPGQFAKAMCVELKRDLRHGSQGEDVRKLQEMLRTDPEIGFNAKATGFFGPLTARAMANFQSRMGIASSTDGRVGPLTRGFFQRKCGNGLDDDMMKGAAVRGEIIASSASSVTVKNTENESRVVNITASTTIHVLATATSAPSVGSIADLGVGKMVMANGEKNADDSINARLIVVGALPPLPPKDNQGRGNVR